jgi:hypothetical protein
VPAVWRRRGRVIRARVGSAHPWQVTVLPSPGCQVTDTGVAVAVTLSPGHRGRLRLRRPLRRIDLQPGRQVRQLQGVLRGAGADHRARQPQRLAGRYPGRAGQSLHRDLAAGRDAAERFVLRACAPEAFPGPLSMLSASRHSCRGTAGSPRAPGVVAASGAAIGRPDAAERPVDAVLAAAWPPWCAFPAAKPQRAATGLPLLP